MMKRRGKFQTIEVFFKHRFGVNWHRQGFLKKKESLLEKESERITNYAFGYVTETS